MELKAKYEQRIEQAEAELRQVKNKILRISTLRVLLFAAGAQTRSLKFVKNI